MCFSYDQVSATHSRNSIFHAQHMPIRKSKYQAINQFSLNPTG